MKHTLWTSKILLRRPYNVTSIKVLIDNYSGSTCTEVACITAETSLIMDYFTVTVAVVSYIKPFRWISSCFQKGLVVQEWSAF